MKELLGKGSKCKILCLHFHIHSNSHCAISCIFFPLPKIAILSWLE